MLKEPSSNWPRYYIISVMSAGRLDDRALAAVPNRQGKAEPIPRIYHPFYPLSIATYKDKSEVKLQYSVFYLPDTEQNWAGGWRRGSFADCLGEIDDQTAGAESYNLGPHLTMIISWIYDVLGLPNPNTH